MTGRKLPPFGILGGPTKVGEKWESKSSSQPVVKRSGGNGRACPTNISINFGRSLDFGCGVGRVRTEESSATL